MQTALIAKPLLARTAGRQTCKASRARNVTVFAAERPTWYPGAKPPKYLTGTMPGYGAMAWRRSHAVLRSRFISNWYTPLLTVVLPTAQGLWL